MLETALTPKPKQIVLFSAQQRTERMLMSTPVNTLKGAEKILVAISEFDYLTAEQVTRLLYKETSRAFVREKLRALVTQGYVLTLGGRAVNLPLIYTFTSRGRTYAGMLGEQSRKRFCPSEEKEKSENFFFMKHTLAVTDVLIASRLLAQTVPGVTLTRMCLERSLRRKIHVEILDPAKPEAERKLIKVCIEPNCSLEFIIHESNQGTNKLQTWRDFFHVEVYRHLPMETLWKQKVLGYIQYAATGQHQALFYTSALSIAVFAATAHQAATLKQWTEEVLHDMPQHGQRFLFRSINTATASPTDIFLSPDGQQAFGTAKTVLLVLKEGHVQ
jgi:hypothetical protein